MNARTALLTISLKMPHSLDLSDPKLHVIVEPYTLFLLAFSANTDLPAVAYPSSQDKDAFFSYQQTSEEISILCSEERKDGIYKDLNDEARQSALSGDSASTASSEWHVLRIRGPLDLSMVSFCTFSYRLVSS